MKILVISAWYPHRQNPTEAPFNAEHVRAIRSAGHQVRVVHVRLGNTLVRPEVADNEWEDTPVTRLHVDLSKPLSIVSAVAAIGREMKSADLIHTMAFSSILPVLPVWAGRSLTGRSKPWVHTEHWNGVVNPASVSVRWQQLAGLRRVLRFPHVVTGVTKQLTQVMSDFSRKGAARTIPCVVIGPDEVYNASFEQPIKLVAVGGLVPRKRPIMAIETVALLRDKGFPVQLTWVGDGPQKNECQALVDRLGLQEAVELVGSVLPREVPDYLSAADVFFLPTEQENFFTSAAEALAAGRPVVATRVGGFSDYANSSNSRLVEVPTPENLAEAIQEAVAAFKDVPAGDLADQVRTQFSLARIGGLFDEAYAEAIARS